MAARTTGGKELEDDGFVVLKEVRLVGRTPGRWFETLAPEGGGQSRTAVLMLRQSARKWHAFYRDLGTGSGSTPDESLSGGLGDVISTDSELRIYCQLLLQAADRLSDTYLGLSAAQSQCFEESGGQI